MIELIVTMAIVGILAAIAIPSYSSYVRKGRRVDAKTAVLDLASLEERFYSTTNAYTNLAADLGYAAAGSTTVVPAAGAGQTVGSGYYQVTIPVLTAATATPPAPAAFKVTATAVGDQLNDTSCYSFSVTSAGARTALNSAGADSTSTCW
jgi:type IV pilus assembly protein PilE